MSARRVFLLARGPEIGEQGGETRTEANHVASVDILIELELRGELLLCLQSDVVDRELDLGKGGANWTLRTMGGR